MSASMGSAAFPIIELGDVLIPWEKCFKVEVGPVDSRAIQIMEERKYDFAPVFEPARSKPTVLGLVSVHRLHELNHTTRTLLRNDQGICRPEIENRMSMSTVLDLMASRVAYIVTKSLSTRSRKPIGLFTRADLNKHPFRATIYSIIAHLETELAELIGNSFSDPWEWLNKLSDEKLARIIGYWEVSKRRGVDIGPLGAMTLSELLNVTGRIETLRSGVGYNRSKAFWEAIGRIPELRNQIMHPVRPLITNDASITKLKEDLETVLHMSQRLKSAIRRLKPVSI